MSELENPLQHMPAQGSPDAPAEAEEASPVSVDPETGEAFEKIGETDPAVTKLKEAGFSDEDIEKIQRAQSEV